MARNAYRHSEDIPIALGQLAGLSTVPLAAFGAGHYLGGRKAEGAEKKAAALPAPLKGRLTRQGRKIVKNVKKASLLSEALDWRTIR